MASTRTHQFIVRNFKYETDFSALRSLRRELDGEELSEETLRDELAAPNQMPARDLWVVESSDNATLAGYSIGYHTVPERYLVWGGVHPNWRRHGIGTTLLEHSIERARELDAEHILINVESQDESAALFLHHCGFRPKSHIWYLHAPANTPLAEPALPQGYRIQSFSEVRDYQVLYDAYYGSCYDLWGNGANSRKQAAIKQPTAEDWWQWFPENDPNGEGVFFVFAPSGKWLDLAEVGWQVQQK